MSAVITFDAQSDTGYTRYKCLIEDRELSSIKAALTKIAIIGQSIHFYETDSIVRHIIPLSKCKILYKDPIPPVLNDLVNVVFLAD